MKISLLKHPLHPPWVHFPMALLPFSFVASVWEYCGGSPELGIVAHHTLQLGLLAALVALATGFVDYLGVDGEGAAERSVQRHLWVMSTGVTAFFAAWLLPKTGSESRLVPLACEAVGTLGLVVGGWLGGHSVYVHGVGRR